MKPVPPKNMQHKESKGKEIVNFFLFHMKDNAKHIYMFREKDLNC